MKKLRFIPVVILMIGVLATPLVGNKPVLVVSGSMEPAVKTGAITLVHFCKVADLEVGDIITYWSPDFEEYITHRVYSVGEDYVIARGDANTVSDPTPVVDDMLMGKVVAVANFTAGFFKNYLVNRTFNRAQLIADLLTGAVVIGLIVYAVSLVTTATVGLRKMNKGEIATSKEQAWIATASGVPALLQRQQYSTWKRLRVYLSYRAYVKAAEDVWDEVNKMKQGVKIE